MNDKKKPYETPKIERVNMFTPTGGYIGLGKQNCMPSICCDPIKVGK